MTSATPPSPTSAASGWTRRLSPLSMGVVALALVLTVFPSNLHLPITGPDGSPEIAPIPGQSKHQSSVAEGSVADSGTVGSGGTGASAGGGVTGQPDGADGRSSVPPPGVPKGRCVGSPPRQTEDPLSPPCAAAFTGDNGGATSKGVTGASVTIVVMNSQGGHDGFDYSSGPRPDDYHWDTTARLLTRFFNTRFETFNRSVHVIEAHGQTVPDIEQHYHPFAVIPLWGVYSSSEAARNRTLTFNGTNRSAGPLFDSPAVLASSPWVWTLNPTWQEGAGAYAGYVCSGLIGRNAAEAGDPSLQSSVRKFAILADTSDRVARLVRDALQQRCDLSPEIIVFDEAKPTTLTTAVAKLRQDGITSVLLPKDSVLDEALKQQYIPEWIWLEGELGTQYGQRQRAPVEWDHSFGLTSRWRWQIPSLTYWYQAALESDPSATPDKWMGSSLYYGLLMAFTAIQLGGPGLTPESARRGLERFTAAFAPPYSPHADYGPADHSFLDDWMIVKWDSSGTPPGGTGGSGCNRLPDEGRRYPTAGPWPTDDRAATVSAATPCQADEVFLSDGAQDSHT